MSSTSGCEGQKWHNILSLLLSTQVSVSYVATPISKHAKQTPVRKLSASAGRQILSALNSSHKVMYTVGLMQACARRFTVGAVLLIYSVSLISWALIMTCKCLQRCWINSKPAGPRLRLYGLLLAQACSTAIMARLKKEKKRKDDAVYIIRRCMKIILGCT